MTPRLLLVEPDSELSERLCVETAALGRIDHVTDFQSARRELLSNAYDWVVTNLRLSAYNGLHLVHLAAAAGLQTRILVYDAYPDLALAREAQLAGAFYESRQEVQRALPAYLSGIVPPQDRRDVGLLDRLTFRSGRRRTDAASAAPRVTPR